MLPSDDPKIIVSESEQRGSIDLVSETGVIRRKSERPSLRGAVIVAAIGKVIIVLEK
jgi:hypothetical protein